MSIRGLVVLLPLRVRPKAIDEIDLEVRMGEVPFPPVPSDVTIGPFLPPIGVPSSISQVPSDQIPMAYPISGVIGDPRPGTPYGAHSGTDYAMPEGQLISALKHGYVRFAGWFDQYSGNVVFIEYDDGIYASFHHLASVGATFVGQEVFAGTGIGFVGHTGAADGPHVHLELRNGFTGIGNPNGAIDARLYYLA